MKITWLPAVLTLSLPAIAASPQLVLEKLEFNAPSDWIEAPVNSAMRKATWRTGADSSAAEISFFAFGKEQGGTVNENIQRWLGQFSDSANKGESATVLVNGRNITFAKSEGTFSSGMPGMPATPLPDYALCGAIIETADGMVFIKMTGPKSTVQQLENTFTELVTKAAKS